MMPFFHDPSLDHLAQEKSNEGCRAQIKGLANRVITSGSPDDLIAAMKIFEEQGYLRDINVTVVRITQACLFIHSDPYSIRTQIREMVPKTPASVKLPDKTLVKMIYSRFMRAIKEAKVYNESSSETRRIAEERLSKNPNDAWAKQYKSPPDIVVKECRSVEDVRALLECFKSTNGANGYYYRTVEREFTRTLSKPELRDHHVSLAWDLIEAGEVMKE